MPTLAELSPEGAEGAAAIDELNERAWTLLVSDPRESMSIAERTSRLSLSEGYREGEAYSALIRGWAQFHSSDLEEAEKWGEASLEGFRSVDDLVGTSKAFNLLGTIDHERGLSDRALDRYMKSFELSKAAGRKDREAAALNNVGEVLKGAGRSREALNYFMRAAEAMRQADSAEVEAIGLDGILFANIGQAMLELGETENAVGYLELALGAAEASGDAASESRALSGLALASRRRGDRDRAHAFMDRSLERAVASGQPIAEAEARHELAVLLIEQDRFTEAEAELDRAAKLCSDSQSFRTLADCYRLRSLARESQGDFKAALADFKLFHDAEVSLSAEGVAQSVRNAEIHFEIERARHEAEIFRLKNVELKDKQEELERNAERLRAVASIGRNVTASLEIDEVARIVRGSLSRFMDVTSFCLAVVDPPKSSLEIRYLREGGRSGDTYKVPLGDPDSFAAWVVDNNEPLRLDDAGKEYSRYIKSTKRAFGEKTASLLYAPLSIGGRVVGVVGVQSPQVGAYDDDDLGLLSALGSYIVVAIENSRVHEEVRRLNEALLREKDALEKLARKVSRIANHDGLTGLPNRLLLGELLEKILSRAKREKLSAAVFFMDLDDFKPINDRHGHEAGDKTLVEAAGRLKSALRASDVVARVGGDEFVAVAADLDSPEDAEAVARKLVAAFDVPVSVDGDACMLGVSIGIALFPRDGKTADELMRKADDAMYSVKRSGKNGYSFVGEKVQD